MAYSSQQLSQTRHSLCSDDASTRLSAALAAGCGAEPDLLETLLERCAVEPDFFVRDMLTWALIRLPAELTVPRLLAEIQSDHSQGRSQALHTLSKIKDGRAWDAITPALLHDHNDEVARAAWRLAAMLVPAEDKRQLANELVKELGRGDRAVQLSLSRALVALGEDTLDQALGAARASRDPAVRAHALATERLLLDPTTGSASGVEQANREFAIEQRARE